MEPRALADREERIALVTRAQHGDRVAFEHLYRLHVDRVHRFTGSLVRNAQEADDATAETFLQAWRDLRRLRETERFEAWLLQIAYRRAMDQIRSRGRTVDLNQAAEVPEARRDRSPQESTEALADVELVRSALADLRICSGR